ncbi:hypothetical protein CYMTET_17652 [Cymbomonas tetramitiformis]|uniref:Uncharacterized protein n=1 Tax=Cymbomonas tetramitiformis TaxID=36881 RepID=A0AAE0G9N7_9CHLO|nr:hypothetical protein CYMTET_17652 [Cymbomonas tetramitiformis]
MACPPQSASSYASVHGVRLPVATALRRSLLCRTSRSGVFWTQLRAVDSRRRARARLHPSSRDDLQILSEGTREEDFLRMIQEDDVVQLQGATLTLCGAIRPRSVHMAGLLLPPRRLLFTAKFWSLEGGGPHPVATCKILPPGSGGCGEPSGVAGVGNLLNW